MRPIKQAVPVLLASFALFLHSSYADVSVGVQDYIVLGRESQVRVVMNQYRNTVTGAAWNSTANGTRANMASRVALTASSNDQYFIYDHWEDGFETMPSNPVDFVPTQATTLIFRMARGQTITLDSSENASSTQCVPATFAGGDVCDFTGQIANLSASPATTTCSYACPIVSLPRVSTAIRFDGGDAIRSFGGPATLVHQSFPSNGPSAQDAFLGAALEHFSQQSMAGFLSYRVPVGQEPDPPVNAASVNNNPFYFARAMVTAFSNNTTITVNNGTEQVTVLLNRGQSYSTSGHDNTGATIDETPAPNIELVAGSRIDSNKEVAVSLINAGSAANHTDMEAVVPVRAYGRDFVVPAGGMGATMRLFLFNPNTGNTTVNVFSSASPGGAAPFVIGPNGSTGYTLPTTPNNADPIIERPRAVRVTSTLPIWGLAIHDYNGGSFDFSASMIPTRFLTNEYVVPYTPSSGGTADAGSAVYIAPVFDNTRVYITYPPSANGDRRFVDITGDGVINAADCTNATGYGCTAGDPGYTLRTYSTVTGGINPYTAPGVSALKLFAGSTTSGLETLAGTSIVADKPLSVIFGPDGTVADSGGNNVDLGFALVPPSPLFVGELLAASLSMNPAVIGQIGTTNTLTAEIEIGVQDVTNPSVTLTLDPDFPLDSPPVLLVGTTGVTGTPGATGDPSSWIFDLDAAGFTLLEAGSTLLGTLTLQSTVNVDDTELISLDMQGSIGGYVLQPTASLLVYRTPLQLTLGAESTANANSTLLYGVTGTNTGATDLADVVVRLPLPEGLLAPTGTITTPGWTCTAIVASNEVSCALSGTLAAGASASFSISASTQALPGGSVVSTRAEGRTSSNPNLSLSNTVATTIAVPDWAFALTVAPTVVRGQSITPVVVITNTSAANATSTIVRIPIPGNTTYVDGSLELDTGSGFMTCTTPAPGAYVECAVGAIAGNSSVSVRLTLATSSVSIGDFSVTADVVSNETPSGRSSAAAIFTVIPPTPTITSPLTGTTVSPSFTVSGAGETGDTVRVTIGAQTFTGTVIGGNYSVNVGPLAEGMHVVSVRQVDSANKSSDAASITVSVDLTAPPITITGPTGGLVMPSFTVTGTSEVGATITLVVDGVTYSPVVMLDGTWSQLVGPVNDGTILITATATDAHNNQSAPIMVTVAVDTAPPAPLIITAPTNGATVGTTFEIRGRGEGGATITVVVDGKTYTATAAGNGTFTITATGVTVGAQQISATQQDGAGFTSTPTVVNITVVDGNIDTFAPQPPVILTPGPGATVPGDNSITVSGTAEPGSTITVTIGESTVTTVATDTGSYIVDVPGPFNDGPTTVTVTATDTAGNTSHPSEQSFNIGGSSGTGSNTGDGNGTDGDPNALDDEGTVVFGGVKGCSCGSNAPPDASFLFLAAALVGLRLRRAARKRQ